MNRRALTRQIQRRRLIWWHWYDEWEADYQAAHLRTDRAAMLRLHHEHNGPMSTYARQTADMETELRLSLLATAN